MGVEVSRLSNGLTVATETLPHIESVALGVWVKSGARNERDDEHGMAHLLEHMAFKGTGRRSAFQIATDIENVGGEINAATSVETTSYYARVLSDDVPLAQMYAYLRTLRIADGPDEVHVRSVARQELRKHRDHVPAPRSPEVVTA